ncbi:hypothetical protein TL16_g11110 [Triparma laevis f. inornata]|uniref:Cytochrome b5 heme-binding domain-containing protein n=2 Tax=Triparma laevis TaxID=1534972 RepID=A0A9W6ZD08_9STRA|nr:hypothetical protein TrLO_g9935 [Triparma laevis f. longispina]GMH88276.1 hypothetical protein TL16_g11110 [Triparma laevis f. inornata]
MCLLLSVGGTCVISKTLDREMMYDESPADDLCRPIDSKVYSEDDVAVRDGVSNPNVWVTYEGGVYDVTKFVDQHPGGKKNLMMGAGGDITQYWDYWSQHRTHPKARSILSSMKIGVLSPSEVEETSDDDLYTNDPLREVKSALLPLHSEESGVAFEGETRVPMLSTFITPNHAFYVRNHAPVPESGDINTPIEVGGKLLSFTELLKKHGKAGLVSTIQCTGNRLGEVGKAMGKDSYFNLAPSGIGLISNAAWSGVRLADVLQSEVSSKWSHKKNLEHLHVEFTGLDGFSKSIPLKHILKRSNNVLIAHEMNGSPLPRDHGSPFRLIAPGLVGAYQIKWLQSIHIVEKPSDSPWQTKFYTFNDGSPIKKWPHTSFITSHEDGGRLEGGEDVSGLAYAGGGKVVAGVQVSVNDGKTWIDTTLINDLDASRWTWRRWKISAHKLQLNSEAKRKGELKIMVRVVDETKANLQPESPEEAVKFSGASGYLFNAIHKVTVRV